MLEELRAVLLGEPAVAYAVLFGSAATGRTHPGSDVDVAIELAAGERASVARLGAIAASLEAAAGRPVHLVLLDEAPPGLAYRVFRDGTPILVRDRGAHVNRRARAILEYLDFQPVEDLLTRGVLAAKHGR
jgi:predicted nucleotidyltransferase